MRAGLPQTRLSLLSPCGEALKVILVCFERQLGSQWYWLSLQVKEMALRKVGGLALWDFLDFIVRTRIPIFVLLRPFIQCKVRFSFREWQPRGHCSAHSGKWGAGGGRATAAVSMALPDLASRTLKIMLGEERAQKCSPEVQISH